MATNKPKKRQLLRNNEYADFKGKVINVAGIALFPVRKISTTPPICFSQEISSYTEIGRSKIHELQKAVSPYVLQQIMENPIQGQSVELNDNRFLSHESQAKAVL